MTLHDNSHDSGEPEGETPTTTSDDRAGLGGPLRVYKFGISPPLEGAAALHEQFRRAHTYANKLIEIERRRRDAVRELEGTYGLTPLMVALREADARVELLTSQAKRPRTETRKRTPLDHAHAQELAQAREARKLAGKAVREKRQALKETRSFIEASEHLGDAADEEMTLARKSSGLFWGTYQLVEAAHSARCAVPMWTSEGLPNNPRFIRRAEASEFVSMQLQKMPVQRAKGPNGKRLPGKAPLALATMESLSSGTDTRVRIGEVDPRAFARGPHGVRRRWNKRIPFSMRVATDDETSEPVWARWHATVHREIPASAIVRRVTVKCERFARRRRWFALLSVEHAPGYRREPCGEGTVALHLGWRQKPDGSLRVAYWVASDGAESEVVLSAEQVKRLRKPDDLESLRDSNFNAARAAFVALRAAGTQVPGDPVAGTGEPVAMPEWLLKETETIAQWRSADRLLDVVSRWLPEYQRFAADGSLNRAPTRLVETDETNGWRPPPVGTLWTVRDFAMWARKDDHISDWAACGRRKALAWRDDSYSCVAAMLARRYGRLLVDDTDYSELARRPEVDEAGDNPHARSNRQLAAASRLRDRARMAMAARGGDVIQVGAPGGTQTCPTCGCIDEHVDAARSIDITCEACGSKRDQDRAFGVVMLLRDAGGQAKVLSRGVPTSGGGGRFAKKRAKPGAPDAPGPAEGESEG